MKPVRLGRRRWRIVAILCAVLFLAAACTDSAEATPTAVSLPTGPPPRTVITCVNCVPVTVTRVIDGDTLVLANGTRVRLYGINTPERGERCFSEATNRLRELAGKTIQVETGPRLEDQFGRLLRYVYTLGGNSIDVLMIGQGLAEAWTRDGQHRDALVALEESARQNRAGCLWG